MIVGIPGNREQEILGMKHSSLSETVVPFLFDAATDADVVSQLPKALYASWVSQVVFPREGYFAIPGKAGMKMPFPGNSWDLGN
jgi:hypothetical protein